MKEKPSITRKLIAIVLVSLSFFLLHTFFFDRALHNKLYAVSISIPPEFTIPPSYKIDPSSAGPTIKAILSGAAQQEGFFSNFPAQYPDIYAFIKNLFDGIEFFIAPSQNTCPNSTPLQGLTIQLQGPNSVPKPENLNYTILVSYSGNQDVVIYDTLPKDTKIIGIPTGTLYYSSNNSVINWDLKQNVPNNNNLYKFQLTLYPTQNNIQVVNTICWSTKTAPSPSSVPSGSPVPSSGPSLTPPPGGNYCDPTYLRQFWPDDANAKYAACVCKVASGDNANYEKIDCTQPYDSSKGNFNSEVGLFADAISNIVYDKANAACDASFQNTNPNLNGGQPTCKIVNQSLFNTCKIDMKDPATNISYAFKQWQNWNLTPPVQNWGYYSTLYPNLASTCGNPPQP